MTYRAGVLAGAISHISIALRYVTIRCDTLRDTRRIALVICDMLYRTVYREVYCSALRIVLCIAVRDIDRQHQTP